MINQSDILNAKVLIAGAQETDIDLLEQTLVEGGYTCVAATADPYEAQTLHHQNHYDLILLDPQFPGMDGFKLLKGLQEIDVDDHPPVLALTAQPDLKSRALAAGAKDFVDKPFDRVEVQTRVHNLLEGWLLFRRMKDYNRMLEQTVQERTAALRQSAAYFLRLAELASDWYWEQNRQGHFTRIHGPVIEMLGIQADMLADETGKASGMRWNQAEHAVLAANIAARRPFLDFVYSRTHPDGSQQYLMVSGEPVFDSSGCFIGYRGVGKDITDSIRSRGF